VSTYISAENLGHSFHDNWLFKNLTIGINRGRRVALVGINGAGKSTLLKILSGSLKPTEGKVAQSKDLNVGYLEQDPHFKNAVTISDYIFHADNIQQQLIRRYEELLENDPDNMKEMDKIMEEMSDIDAWDYEYKIKTILGRLDIHHLNQHISTLSGGQKKRLALAKLLIEDPEIYILDEPTNHLDLESITALNNGMQDFRGNIIFTSRDHELVQTVATRIIEITPGGAIDKLMTYDEYINSEVVQKQREEMYAIA
jgi:ATP-binding cassette subfamily F protein uup